MNQIEERNYHDEDEIDLMELVKVLLDNKCLLIFVTLVSAVLITLGGYLYNKKNVTSNIIIGFNYQGIEQGLNPDNTQFSKENIIGIPELDFIFNKYKDKGIKAEDLEEFRENLSVDGIIPANITQRIETALRNGETVTYTPTQYKIVLKEKNKSILEELTENVFAEFNRKYKPQYKISGIEISENYDYDDYIALITEQLERLNSETTSTRDREKENYVSKATGVSYEEIKRKLSNFRNIEFNRYTSYITLNGFSNRNDMKQVKLESEIELLELDREKLLGQAEVIKRALDDYKPEEKQIIVPSMGELGIKLDDSNEYYTKLIGDYIAVNTKMKNTEYDIKYKQDEIKKIKFPTDEENKYIYEMTEKLVEDINQITDTVNNLNQEFYDEKYGEMIKKITPVELSTDGKPMVLFLAVGVVLGFFAGIFVVFLKEFSKNYKLKYAKK